MTAPISANLDAPSVKIARTSLLTPDVTAIPDYIDVPSTPPGGVAHIGPITFAGATPGEELCFNVGIHDEQMSQCCSEEVCVVVPQSCAQEPKVEPKSLSANGMACATHTGPNSTSTPAILLGLATLAGWFRRRRPNARPAFHCGSIAAPESRNS